MDADLVPGWFWVGFLGLCAAAVAVEAVDRLWYGRQWLRVRTRELDRKGVGGDVTHAQDGGS